MKARGLPEAFVPDQRHYYVAREVRLPVPLPRSACGLYPASFVTAPVDPNSVYSGLSSYDRRRVREARIQLWSNGPYDYLVPRERELLAMGL